MRKYKKVVNSKKRRYGDYTPKDLEDAVAAVQSGMKLRDAQDEFGIPKSTLNRKINGKQPKVQGGQTCLSREEEEVFVNHLIMLSEWGFPFSKLDLRLTVKSYLDKSGRNVKRFKDNIPGEEWARSFMKRHKDRIRSRTCQNIKTARSDLTKETFAEYFENLKEVIADVPACNILNYDETNLGDDPGAEKLIFKRGKKYPERIMNYTKGNTSIMFSGTATGELLPVYVVYKSVNLWQSWTNCGPKKARYNRSKSGWFDAVCFDDWFQTVVVPWAKKKDGKKVVIGDNLSSHFSTDVIKLCEEHNISFVCLVPNSTHLSQPLDVAFYGPLKRKWRKIIKNWILKNPSKTTLPKDEFPKLLKELLEVLNCDNLISGFKAAGIHPFCPEELYKKLPSENNKENDPSLANVSDAVLDHLKLLRNPENPKPRQKRKKVDVAPGKSICLEDFDKSSDEEEEESCDSENSESEISQSENSESEEETGSRIEENSPHSALQELEFDDVKIDQWVKVVYEEEIFVGIVREKLNGEVKVQCLSHPFGIKLPQLLESENAAVFYEQVYEADVTPTLKKFGRGWKYVY